MMTRASHFAPLVLAFLLTGCCELITRPAPAPVALSIATPVPTDKPITATPVMAETIKLPCSKRLLFTVGDVAVWHRPNEDVLFFQAGMSIKADGAPDAYHPADIGTDSLDNARLPGSSWALVTDEDGEPIVQGPEDPMPGYYVSSTDLQDSTRGMADPRRYVDANEIPFVVLPQAQCGGAQLGDFVTVVNRANDSLCHAIFADLGIPNHIGEGSIALAKALGIDASPRHGGTSRGVVYVVFANSGNGSPRSLAEINSESDRLFEAWGGMARVDECFPRT